jgi:hypothetical protein
MVPIVIHFWWCGLVKTRGKMMCNALLIIIFSTIVRRKMTTHDVIVVLFLVVWSCKNVGRDNEQCIACATRHHFLKLLLR